MRVITGTARGRRLISPEGLDTRPTSGLVKEAIFSAIQFETEGASVLDLFAGSGQMGVEALSRGARSCVFVEQSKVCCAVISKNLAASGLSQNARVVTSDVVAYLQAARAPVDIAFVDPPYQKKYMEKVLRPLSDIISENGAVICETSVSEGLPQSAGALVKRKEYRYGKTKVTLYRKDGGESD